MVIEVEVIGNGHYQGAKSNIGQYSVSEESTPVQASDMSGGSGQISFDANDDPSRFGSQLLFGDTIKLSDGDRGTTTGKVTALHGEDGALSVTASSLLGQLVVDKQAVGKQDTLSNVLRYYITDLGGIPWSMVAVAADLANIPVRTIGWKGDVWTKVKELLITVGAEISLVRGTVVIRKVRERRALEINTESESWDISTQNLAKQVEVFYYNSVYKSNSLIYPAGGWDPTFVPFQVSAESRTVVNQPIDVYLDDVPLTQPTPVDYVDIDYSASSVYCVAGVDGRRISAADWTRDGGFIKVTRGTDGKSFDIIIQGPGGLTGAQGPFRIGVSTGGSAAYDYYSSLRLIGSGVHFKRESVIVPTAATEPDVVRDVGVSVDNVAIATKSQALDIAANVASAWATPTRTLRITKSDINRPASSEPEYDYATFADFDAYAAANGISTFANFDSAWTGKTFEEFDDFWYEKVANDFRFQVFGNVGGARLQWRRSMYRIRSANTTPDGVEFTAEADTTFGDFDSSAGPSMTFADFDALYSGMTFNDFALIPLPYVDPSYER